MGIDLFGDLKKISASKFGGASKVVLDIKAPKLVIDTDEKAIAQIAADAITNTIKSNLLAGLKPDGSPLPAAARATLERREYRKAQDARGGKPAARFRRDTYPNARKNHRKRFKAPRLGTFRPSDGSVPRGKVGLESGMLAKSVLAIVNAGGFRVFFANPRALADESGKSPVGRVFDRIGIWSAKAQQQPAIQGALQGVAKALASGRKMKAIKSVLQTAKAVGGLLKSTESTLG